MKLSEIQELIKFVVKSGATEVTYEIKGFKLTIKAPGKNGGDHQQHIVVQAPVATPVQTPITVSAEKKSPEKKKETPATSADESKYITIKSPMIGTFYRSSSPDKPAFVNVGDEIKKGQTLCIIEAMKLFNEIESEHAGKIVKVLVEDASPVEYDQPLFLIEPK
ncbi:MAG: acetyl-CoA carboxylase biotin carboxyl carrier protein [Bacteroidetes bacterium]|nr:acetyl-CoA carboxylase biotin carboxyl carrier protein [Bacteroidota bacterium]